MITRTLALLTIVALPLVTAGCGGDAESETQAGDAIETSPADGAAAPGLGELSDECLALVGAAAKYAEALQQAGTGDVSSYVDVFAELVESAPDEIKGDLQVIADGIAGYADELEDIGLGSGVAPTPEQLQRIQELGERFDEGKLGEATANIEAWASENCANG